MKLNYKVVVETQGKRRIDWFLNYRDAEEYAHKYIESNTDAKASIFENDVTVWEGGNV